MELQIKKFNPPFRCNGGIHYAINPYINCAFNCTYCYANRDDKIETMAALNHFKNELKSLPPRVVEIGTSTDAYQYMEKKCRLTRKIIQILNKHRFPILINTKSDLVLRDLDVFHEIADTMGKEWLSIGISINKLTDNRLDVAAPAAHKRVETLKKLLDEGINAYLRYDPVVPFYNDDETSIREVFSLFAHPATPLKRVTTSTFKPTSKKILRRVDRQLDLDGKLIRFYADAKWIKGTLFLPNEKVKTILDKVNSIASDYNFDVATCRERIYYCSDNYCDNIDYSRNYAK
ncbi:MAG: hypothetical protein GF364_16655 [Candidatus Lokiarchaeota archaeon]|nr:hypothetical protein [Candidatus Lokiarchaeota archaeon]